MQRIHIDPKKSRKFVQSDGPRIRVEGAKGHKCQVAGCKKAYSDCRYLKVHYLDRRKHTVEALLEAQVDVWNIAGMSEADAQCTTDWLENKGIVVRVEAEDSADEDYQEVKDK